MTKSITSLSDNILQTPRRMNSLKTRPIIINSIVTEHIKYKNVTLKETAVSHNLTTCSNSKVLLKKPKTVKRPSQPSASEEKISNIMRTYINIAPKDATASNNVTHCPNSKDLSNKSRAVTRRFHNAESKIKMSEAAKRRSQNPEFKAKMSKIGKRRWEDPDYKKKMAQASKCRWQDPEFKKKVLNSKKSRYKDSKFIQLSRQRADEAIASVLAQTQDQKIKEESQEDVLSKGNDELQIIGSFRVTHEINNTLPILQDPNDPTHSLLYEVEGSIDQIKISRYGGVKLSTSQKKQILEEVKQWIRFIENDRKVYQQKFEELFEISIPIEIGPDRGRSVYAKRNIRRFEVVGPYAGILQRSEEEFRRSIRQKGSYNVLSYLFGTRSKHRIVDGFNTSNTTSLINTGQLQGDPIWNDNNLVIIQVGKNLNFYVAKLDIAQGEELLVDYGTNYNPRCFLKSETEG